MSPDKLVNKSVQMDNFAAMFMTSGKGGLLTIPSKNVSLNVPPDALPATEQPQLVYVYVCDDETLNPPLNKEESWLTPTVRCGPPGLKFQTEVILKMPHCALHPHQWEFCFHETKKKEGGKWRRVNKHEDPLQDMNIAMPLHHFCGEKISGKAKQENGYVQKAINVHLFMERRDQREDPPHLSVLLSNRYHGRVRYENLLLLYWNVLHCHLNFGFAAFSDLLLLLLKIHSTCYETSCW